MITIVIPAKNEANAITKVINSIKTVLNIKHEIIVVDDGSDDDTKKNATKAGALVISNPTNLGYGASLKRGINHAKYEMIGIIDADNTYPVKYFPDLIKMYKSGFDMAVGARTGKYYDESFIKKTLRGFLRFMVNFVSGSKSLDVNSGMRVFSKKNSMKYFNRLCNTFSFSTSLTLAYLMSQKFVGYVKIPYEKRIGKSKVNMIKDSLRTIQYILEITIYYNPLKIFILLSSLIMIVSIILFILGFITKIKIFYFSFLIGLSMATLSIIIGFLAVLFRQILVKD